MNDAITWGIVALNAAWLIALVMGWPTETRHDNRLVATIGLTAIVNAAFALFQLI